MDSKKREALIKTVAPLLAGSKEGQACVPLETFLDGNDDDASFASNVFGSLDEPAAMLRAVAKRPDVKGVYVEIVDALEDDATSWPFADRAYVVTSADPDELAEEHFEESPPAAAEVVPPKKRPTEIPAPPAGFQLVSFWWD